jgi:hypothetical protein
VIGVAQRKSYVHVTIPMITRMRELRAAGLGAAAVATVIKVDYGVLPSRPTVDKYAPRHDDAPYGAGLGKGGGGTIENLRRAA